MLIAADHLNCILIAYLFALSLRIVLGWFAPQALGKAWDFLTSATDPYLEFFSASGSSAATSSTSPPSRQSWSSWSRWTSSTSS